MAKLSRLVIIMTALYMAASLIWDGARNPYMGLDYTLYGVADRPANLIDQTWSAQAMQSWADRFDVDVVVSATPQDPGLVAGYPGSDHSDFSQWLAVGYPCVRKPCITKARSLVKEPALIQNFDTGSSELSFMGDNAKAAAIAAQEYYGEHGWETQIADNNSMAHWFTQFKMIFSRTFFVVAVLVFMLTAGGVLARSKSVGVQALQGIPRWQILSSGVIESSFWLWMGLGLTSVATYLVVRIAFEGHFFSYVAVGYLVIATVLWLISIAGQVVAHLILRTTSIQEAIKGRVRFGLSFPIIYSLRSLVLILLGTLSLSLGYSLSQIQIYESTRANVGSLGDYSSFTWNSAVAENVRAQDKAAVEVTRLYNAGKMVYTSAQPYFFYVTASQEDPTILQKDSGKTVIEANIEYLKMYPTLLANGKTLSVEKDIQDAFVTILFPRGTPGEVKEAIRSSVSHERFTRGRVKSDSGWNANNVPVRELEVVESSRQYSMAGGVLREFEDPIMVILPHGLSLSSEFVFSGGDGILMKTSELPEILESNPNLRRSTALFIPLKEGIDQSISLAREGLFRGLAELIAYLIVLPLSTVGVVFMYSREHTRRIFTQSVFGRPLIEMIPLLIALDVIAVAVIAWLVRPKAATVTELMTLGSGAYSAPTRNFTIVLTLLGLMIAAEYLLFSRERKRIIATRGAAEA